MTIRVQIIDRHTRFAQAMCAILMREPDVQVVATVSVAAEAVRTAQELRPDVVLLDVDLPVEEGVAAIEQLTELQPATGILVLTLCQDPAVALNAIRGGARGYLSKTLPIADVTAAVRSVAQGGAVLDGSIGEALLREYRRLAEVPRISRRVTSITDAERDLLRMLSAGQSNKQLARTLGRAESTVKNSLTLLYEKLGVKNRTQAAMLAYKLLATPSEQRAVGGAAPPTPQRSSATGRPGRNP